MKEDNLHKVLFFLILLIYLFSRIVKIEDFPIYFFNDEASQGVKAEELLNNHFKDKENNFIPMTISSTGYHQLGLVVHFNIPGVFLFGKKIWVERTTSALLALIGCVYIALIAKNVFKIKFYWAAVLFLAFSPIFFLFSRTGFEAAVYTSFFAGFIYYYLRYRTEGKYYIFISIIFALLAFYTSAIIWPILISMIIFIFLLDLSYHLKNLKQTLFGFSLVIISLLPLINYHYENRFVNSVAYLKSRNSIFTEKASLNNKINTIRERYSNFFMLKFQRIS